MSDSASIQWYPGHMTKARRMMQENIRLVDIVIELLDARIPLSGRNPDIDRLAEGKARIVILAKEDLADPAVTASFLDWFRGSGYAALAMDARAKDAKGRVLKAIRDAAQEKRERDLRRGIRNRSVRAMICGIPNAGKSTFINTLSGHAGAKTGDRPGVTTGKQWISLGGIDLLDTPGILWPKFEDPAIGLRLAAVGSIRDEVLDEEEVALRLLRFLLEKYPELVCARYGELSYNRKSSAGGDTAGESAADGSGLLEEIGLKRGLLRKGGAPDTARAAHLVLDEFRKGRIGRITLDAPPAGTDVF